MLRKAALAAFSVLAMTAIAFLLVRNLPSRYVYIRAYTDDAGGLTEGTSVRLNGILVGYLDKLNLTDSRDPGRKIEFVMKVRRRYLAEIPADSLLGIEATNLLGNYFVNITRGSSNQRIEPGGELRSTVAIDPNKLLAQMGREFQEIQAILDRADKLVAAVPEGHGNVGRWSKEGMTKLDDLAGDLKKLTNDIQNGHGNLSHMDDLKTQMDTAQGRLNDLMSGFQAGQGTAGKLQGLSAELQQATAEAKSLSTAFSTDQGPGKRLAELQGRVDDLRDRIQSTLDKMNAGQGTVGQFMVNPNFSEALTAATTDFQAVVKGLQSNPKKSLSFTFRLF